jgi:hypothetical protein
MTRDTRLFFDGCKNHLNSEEALSGIPDIENSEIDEHLVEIRQGVAPRPSTAEPMSHHRPSLAHASFFDDIIAALLAP